MIADEGILSETIHNSLGGCLWYRNFLAIDELRAIRELHVSYGNFADRRPSWLELTRMERR